MSHLIPRVATNPTPSAGLGIAIVNDFKSIEGDRALGLVSLPVQFGVERAKWICAGTIDATQLAVALYLARGPGRAQRAESPV